MNSLLARQIRKLIPKYLATNAELLPFLEAVEKSYLNYEDQFNMLQRAMSISSEELFEVNSKLTKEAKQQKQLINKLKKATQVLEKISLPTDNTKNINSWKFHKDTNRLDGVTLALHIEAQAKQISKIENQRKKIFEALEKSNEELSQYAHVVSHDLKTPLRNIDTLINWIKEDSTEKLPEVATENLKLIEKNVEKMDNLIHDILEYSLINKRTTTISYVNIEILCTEIINWINIPPNIQINLGRLPTIPSDKIRLKQLFQNLITNSINSIDKPEGLVEVNATEKDTHWQFSVSDNGKGIPKKYHEKIFEVFQSLEKKENATGIGLSIVKKIVTFLEGKIWLKSVIGEGTTVFFTIKKTTTNGNT